MRVAIVHQNSVVMMLGFAIIAVPTGIVATEMSRAEQAMTKDTVSTQVCGECSSEGHQHGAHFCKDCGARL